MPGTAMRGRRAMDRSCEEVGPRPYQRCVIGEVMRLAANVRCVPRAARTITLHAGAIRPLFELALRWYGGMTLSPRHPADSDPMR